MSFAPHASPGRGQAPALQGSHTIIRGRCYSLSRWSRKLAPEIHFRTNDEWGAGTTSVEAVEFGHTRGRVTPFSYR